MKLVWLIVLLCILYRLINARWPWQSAQRLAHGRNLAQARARLGIAAAASRREVVEAHRQALAAAHPDRGGSNEQVHEVNAARDLILAELDGPTQPQR